MNYTALYRTIGYYFKNENLLTTALTHRSKQKNHNERLEFLGDAILGMVMAELLYHRFPDEPEGTLSQLRRYLIKGPTLSELAKTFQLGDYMRLGVGEIKSGGKHRKRLLEDCLEALIGAVYLDSDLATIQALLQQWFDPYLTSLSIEKHTKDPKSRLQELLFKHQYPRPDYQTKAITGDRHDQTFEVCLQVPYINQTICQSGKSRKSAEQQVARQALALLMEQGFKDEK